jgi:hypothetical protein
VGGFFLRGGYVKNSLLKELHGPTNAHSDPTIRPMRTGKTDLTNGRAASRTERG